jgi:CNT family concentrative nucleoside transporter
MIDAIARGAGDGFKIAMNVIAMLIGFIAIIALVDYVLVHIGHIFNPDLNLSLNYIFSKIFYPFAWSMGVPSQDIHNAATLLGQKLTVNEFVAFQNLTNKKSSAGNRQRPRDHQHCHLRICEFQQCRDADRWHRCIGT